MKRRIIVIELTVLLVLCFYVLPTAGLAQAQRTPFSASIKVEMNPGEIEESAQFVQVPANKRLTIVFVSVRAFVPVKQEVLFLLQADNPDFIPLTFQGVFFREDGPQSVFAANQAVTVFAGPGKEVIGVFRRSKGIGQTGDLIATIFGFLDDLP